MDVLIGTLCFSKRLSTIVLFLLGVLLQNSHFVYSAEFAYTVHVPAGKMECYFQNVTDPRYTSLEIDFQVIDGGDLNVNFLVKNPQNTVIAHFMDRSDGTQRIDLTGMQGDYQVCFDNTNSYQHFKSIFFELFLYDAEGNLDDDDEMSRFGFGTVNFEEVGVQAETFNTISAKIKGNLNKAEHYQALLRAWEARDRAIMDSNLNRVGFWSIANTAVLLIVGCVQVYMIRSLFEDKSRVGNIIRQKT